MDHLQMNTGKGPRKKLILWKESVPWMLLSVKMT
ncbi:hypothetical protein ACHAXS_001883 [Conticribra weissflogii]